MATTKTVSRGKGPVKPAGKPAGKPKPAAEAPGPDASFEELMAAAVSAVPEEPELEAGSYRFKIGSVKPDPEKGRIVMMLRAIEDSDGVMNGTDISTCRPVFQRFNPANAGDMRQFSEIVAASGADTELSRTEIIENKALIGVELMGSVTKSEAKDGSGRIFTNVRGLRVPE